MKYLLDTHTLIWYFERKLEVNKKPKTLIDNHENSIYVSIVSIWEIVIKQCAKRLHLNFTIDDLFESIKIRGYTLLPIKEEHLRFNLDLPMIHGDPFDRLLIATAISENMKFITSDKENQLYDVEWVWE